MTKSETTKVFVVGMKGLPAAYGGFETMVEYLVARKSRDDVAYTVFCDGFRGENPRTYSGAQLRYLGFKANGAQSIAYDILGLLYALWNGGTVLVLGTSGALAIPLLKVFGGRCRVITNIGGLEWSRDKWGGFAQWFLKKSESAAVRYSDVLIADNEKLIDYVGAEYGVVGTYIAYGGDHYNEVDTSGVSVEEHVGIGDYYVAVARCQIDNNIEMVLDAFADSKESIVFVSNWASSDYGNHIKAKYENCRNIRLIGPIYDVPTLVAIRAGAKGYIHGHSAGGTNPALVESMWLGSSIFAFSNGFNQCTAEEGARYFEDTQSLQALISAHDVESGTGRVAKEVARRKFKWSDIVMQYERLF